MRAGQLVAQQHGAQGQAAAQRLGQRQDVRRDPGVLIREQPSRASQTALDLIHDEQGAPLATQGGEAAQELRRGRPHAALSLDRLDGHGGGRRADGRGRGGEIVPWAEAHTGEERLERGRDTSGST